MKLQLLGNICEINPKLEKGVNTSLKCSFIPMECINDYSGKISKQYTRTIAEVEKGYTYFRNGDVLFAKITPCMENGKCAIAKKLTNGIGFGSTEFHVIRASKSIIPEWVFYFLRQESIKKYAEQNMTGSAGQKRVPSGFIQQLGIPLPPLAEQKRIAGILEKCDRLRRTRRYTLQLSDTFLQSVFLEMFGDQHSYERKILSEVCLKIFDCKHYTPPYVPEGIPLIKTNDVIPGFFQFGSTVYVSSEEYEKLTDVNKPEQGDIVFAREGSFGVASYVANNRKYAIGQRMMLLRTDKSKANPIYLTHFINSPSAQENLLKVSMGTTVKRVNVGDVKELPISIPPLPLQEKFAQIVQKYERLRTQQRESDRQAEHLFQTLLHRAFRGDLTNKMGNTGFEPVTPSV